MKLEWGPYKQFPYERELGIREASALLECPVSGQSSDFISIDHRDVQTASLLTYFSSVEVLGSRSQTIQNKLERSADTGTRRQSTRYSVHGLHEYRGKFNPQVCRALLNILAIRPGDVVFDPFCGSGTTLVEAAHLGIWAAGTDLNPLAVFIANAKLDALTTPASRLDKALAWILRRARSTAKGSTGSRLREAYLKAWFEDDVLSQIESLKGAIEAEEPRHKSFFLTVASNLLREFSLQEPADLRIRRRPTAGVTVTFGAAFESAARDAIRKLAAAQNIVGTDLVTGRAWLKDNRLIGRAELPSLADAAITSPPYATALPYIDTQRLSLVWLGLLPPEDIATVDAALTGSREMSTKDKRLTEERLDSNEAGLPESEATFCAELQGALVESDGFRRRAVPVLLYRYFEQMGATFKSVAATVKVGAPFALIVGHNHTVLGGKRFDIDTPRHLASLARHAGWSVTEITPLQAYRRFGLHASNGVTAETLLVLKAGPNGTTK